MALATHGTIQPGRACGLGALRGVPAEVRAGGWRGSARGAAETRVPRGGSVGPSGHNDRSRFLESFHAQSGLSGD